ncbi:MAG: DUF4350 domain-containing protein [Cyanobacteria bacterium P01_G01_bin.38]
MSRTFSNRYVWMGLIVVVLLGLLSVLLAPNSRLVNGSTFNRAPNGYLGWYREMVERGIPLERWQRPYRDLPDRDRAEPADPVGDQPTGEQATGASSPQTLIQVRPRLVDPSWIWSETWVKDWLSDGNRLIVLGINRAVTAAPFSTQQESPQGNVVVQTRRRQIFLEKDFSQILGDDSGAVVWQESRDEGTITFATTPYLAANAYQSETGNYEFLAALVTETDGPIWIDEYLHGYREAEDIVQDVAKDWFTYLTRTPILVAGLQIAVLMGVLILAQNQRLGTRSVIRARQVDNSQAYIQALAGVLHKAGGYRFVAEMIAKEERLHLQKALGFGEVMAVDEAVLGQAWVQKSGGSASDLRPLFKPPPFSTAAKDSSLIDWLAQLQRIRRQLEGGRT